MTTDDEMMAKIEATAWFQTRPRVVQEAIRLYPNFRTYLMPKTNEIVRIHAYSEGKAPDGKVYVGVDVVGRADAPKETWPALRRRVFGIPLTELEPFEPDESATGA
jgi:hypothetical protein